MSTLTEAEIFNANPAGLISRDAARSIGAKHYNNGRPCSVCDGTSRYVSDRGCVKCTKARSTARVAENPDALAVRKAWYAINPGYQRNWYAENADRERARIKAKRLADPSKFIVHSNARRARKVAAEGVYTCDDLANIRKMQKDKCAYCRVGLMGKGTVDHIHPLSKGGSNWPKNIQLLCTSCNCAKNAKDPIDFVRSIGRLV